MCFNVRRIGSAAAAVALLTATIGHSSRAQTEPSAPTHEAHAYTAYEQIVRHNVSQFHRNFNNRQFELNGGLVADDLHVDSNGKESRGREAFVKQIARFVVPFPDVKITDLVTAVDGNVATVRFVVTGTHQGDLETPGGVIHATNNAIRVDGIEYFTFDAKGKLIDLLTVEDLAGLMQQLKASK